MTPTEGTRVFISYSHRDGGDVALWLHGELRARGFDIWLDTRRLKGGDVWSKEIETAIDHCDVAVALLSTGSYESDICRAEQERSLAKHKPIIPVRVQRDCDVPLILQTRQYVAFIDAPNYALSLEQLVTSIRERHGVIAHAESRRPYNNSPPLPEKYVDRPELLARLRDSLFQQGPNRNLALTAVAGMGGIGKTVLAQALCHEEVVQHAYPDGIFWFTIGRESSLRFDERVDAVPGLKRMLGIYNCEAGCVSQYRDAMKEKAALIVLDDVWRTSDVECFRTQSPRSRVLFTTRDSSIVAAVGAREHMAQLLDARESREVLAQWTGLQPESLPDQANEVIAECGRLPLALAVVGALLRRASVEDWQDTLELLRRADITAIEEQLPSGQASFFRAVKVSLEALTPTMQDRYRALAVLLEEMSASVPILQTVWAVTESEARRIGRYFVEHSLAQRDDASCGIRLHDLELDYIRRGYADKRALALIHGALRLSFHVFFGDPEQFASQVTARLLPFLTDDCDTSRALQRFCAEIVKAAPRPWVRALWPTLDPPDSHLIRTFTGHSAEVTSVAVSADGRRAVSASADKTLKVWDLETGTEVRTLIGHSKLVVGVALSADGRRAVSASFDTTLKVWDLETGTEVRTLADRSMWSLRGVALSADGRRAVSVSDDKTMRVWDLENGAILRKLDHSSPHYAVAVSADGRRAVSGGADQTLKAWDLETGTELRTLIGHSNTVTGVDVSADWLRAVSASYDGTFKVWDLITGTVLLTLTASSHWPRNVTVSTDGRRAVSASADHTLKLWDLGTGAELRTLIGHSDTVSGVAITVDGRRAVSASADHTLKLWDLESRSELRAFAAHSRRVRDVAVSADGRRAVSASDEGTLKVWDLDSGTELRTLLAGQTRLDWFTSVALSADGRQAVSASSNRVQVWDLETGTEARALVGHTGMVWDVAVSGDGLRAVSVSDDQTMRVWDLKTGRKVHTLMHYYDSDSPIFVAVTADGRRAVSVSETLKVWDLDNGIELCRLGHSTPLYLVAVSADGRRAVSASRDNMLRVWDSENGIELCALGHSSPLCCVAVSADGRRAVSASRDKTLRVWTLENGSEIMTFTADADFGCCAWAGDRKIVAGDEAGRVHFFELVE